MGLIASSKPNNGTKVATKGPTEREILTAQVSREYMALSLLSSKRKIHHLKRRRNQRIPNITWRCTQGLTKEHKIASEQLADIRSRKSGKYSVSSRMKRTNSSLSLCQTKNYSVQMEIFTHWVDFQWKFKTNQTFWNWRTNNGFRDQ